MATFHLTTSSWDEHLKDYLPADYSARVRTFLDREYQGPRPIYPARDRVFYAYQKTPFEKVKVVILGQDPYHQPGQAQGLSFSVPDGMKTPPSLRNILKELDDDLGQVRLSQDLTSWAEQGVLLLNAVLTVEESAANAHQGLIWEALTDASIQALSDDEQPKVFILWGSFAQKKAKLIDDSRHCILASAHPSPLSAYRGFFGSKPFSKTNQFLKKASLSPISWLE
nr:uracil-DNA glycosylase [Fructobacillus papyrifericola]